MPSIRILLVAAACAFGLVSSAQAALIVPGSATGSGTFNNSPSLLINGVIPSEGTAWTAGTNVWWYGTTPKFTIDLSQLYLVEDIVLQVDNNDGYKLEYSTDDVNWTTLLTVSISYGEISNGMDTMSTMSGSEYVSGIDFSTPVTARYLRVYATGGDNMYAISEVQAYGTPVPEPGTLLLLGSGLLGVGAWARKTRKIHHGSQAAPGRPHDVGGPPGAGHLQG